MTTAQTFAHEIAHSLGIFHDFNKPTKSGRQDTCGPKKRKGGDNNQIMNYGRPRQSTWSECSNEDFHNYYTRVYAKGGGFCLKGNFDLNNIPYPRQCNATLE